MPTAYAPRYGNIPGRDIKETHERNGGYSPQFSDRKPRYEYPFRSSFQDETYDYQPSQPRGLERSYFPSRDIKKNYDKNGGYSPQFSDRLPQDHQFRRLFQDKTNDYQPSQPRGLERSYFPSRDIKKNHDKNGGYSPQFSARLPQDHQFRRLYQDKTNDYQPSQPRGSERSYFPATLPTSPQSKSIFDNEKRDQKDQTFVLSGNVVSPKHAATTRPQRVVYDPPKIPESKWTDLEQKSQEEQRQFLKQWESHFKEEAVSGQKMNVERGDHIHYPGSIGIKDYEHHFLCTGVNGSNIDIIEYTGPSFGFSASSRSSASKNPLAFAKIQTRTVTYKDLTNKKAKIVKWPKELERFTVDESIKRAKKRKGEPWYDVLENNCEHFVMWCKCGLNTSLQVKPWYRTAWEGLKAVGNAGLQAAKTYGIEVGAPFLAKAAANVSDELAGVVSSSLGPIGFGIGAVIEAGIAGYDIYKDYKKMKQGLMPEREFREKTVKTSCKATGRVSCGIAGSIVGTAIAGPIGSVVGGAVGALVGHCGGSAVAYAINSAPKIAKAAVNTARKIGTAVKNTVQAVGTAVKSAVNTCVSYIKTGAKKVIGFFKSLFSWW